MNPVASDARKALPLAALANRAPLRISIVGVGLIGGSLGMALGRLPQVAEVVGVARRPDTVTRAVEMGAVTRGTTDLEEGVAGADVVYVATPVGTIVPVMQQILPRVPADCIVTDAGSTKVEICDQIGRMLPPGVTFIGGHPMAGSEQTGVEAADPYLFENAVYVLTPRAGEDPDAVAVLTDLVRGVGAQPLVLTPEEHDIIVAAVSHLPHVIAGSLVNAVGDAAVEHQHMLSLAAGGFRDTTRIASGDPELWRDICLTNREPILALIDRFEMALADTKQALAAGDGAGLAAELERARTLRAEIPARRKGIISQIYEMVVQVADRPGAISHVTSVLAAAGTNIIDIEILRVREGEGGTLRLAFENAPALAEGLVLLQQEGYKVRRR